MAIRNTKLINKHSDIVSRPLPNSLLTGEAIVNTADGIMWYSGVTTSTNNWTPAGTGSTANFFEVGSNLYDLRLRNKITKYQGQTGAGLSGKFLSGTTSGFVLANISSIAGIDSYLTGGTFNNVTDTITLKLNNGKPNVVITGLTDYYVTGGTISNIGTLSLKRNDGTQVSIPKVSYWVTGSTGTSSLKVINGTTTDAKGNYSLSVGKDTKAFGANSFAGGDSSHASGTTSFVHSTNSRVVGNRSVILGGQNITGTTNDMVYVPQLNINTIPTLNNSSTQILARNASTGNIEYKAYSSFTAADTYVTGFTYTNANNTLTIQRNQSLPALTAKITQVSGLTVSNLTSGQVVYASTSGLLKTESGFEYNDLTNTLLSEKIATAPTGSAFVGTGGLVVGSGGSSSTPGTGNLVVHGNLTIFGTSISAHTSELYVEDKQITLNYNPTGDTSSTSLGSGFGIQDGDGSGNDVFFEIRAMNTFTGLTSTQIPIITEYTSAVGFTNRAWVTQLKDLVIRSTNTATPNGVRVLAEFDVLDGGSY